MVAARKSIGVAMNLDHVVLLHVRHVIDHQTKGKVRQRIGERTRLNAEGNVDELVRAVLRSSSYAHAMRMNSGADDLVPRKFANSNLASAPANFVLPEFFIRLAAKST